MGSCNPVRAICLAKNEMATSGILSARYHVKRDFLRSVFESKSFRAVVVVDCGLPEKRRRSKTSVAKEAGSTVQEARRPHDRGRARRGAFKPQIAKDEMAIPGIRDMS